MPSQVLWSNLNADLRLTNSMVQKSTLVANNDCSVASNHLQRAFKHRNSSSRPCETFCQYLSSRCTTSQVGIFITNRLQTRLDKLNSCTWIERIITCTFPNPVKPKFIIPSYTLFCKREWHSKSFLLSTYIYWSEHRAQFGTILKAV